MNDLPADKKKKKERKRGRGGGYNPTLARYLGIVNSGAFSG